jgi:cytoskeletal protein CcmA (bactofilin family)
MMCEKPKHEGRFDRKAAKTRREKRILLRFSPYHEGNSLRPCAPAGKILFNPRRLGKGRMDESLGTFPQHLNLGFGSAALVYKGRRSGRMRAVAAFAAVLFFSMQNSSAIDFIRQDHFTLEAEDSLQNELWVSAQTITVSGEVLDDLFTGGGTIELNGVFKGDVWSIGDQVTAAGQFMDHVRLAARTVQIPGTFSRSLTAAGTTVKIDAPARIAGNLLCFSDQFITEGRIDGNLKAVAKRITLGGKISGNVSLTANEIVLLPGTVIEGHLNYTAPKELILSPAVTLNGKLSRSFAAIQPRRILKANLIGHFSFWAAALFAGLVFGSVFPSYFSRTAFLLRTAYGPCVLTGSAALFLIPVIAFALLFTVIGLPLSLLLSLFYLILLYLSRIAAGLWLGGLILRRKELSRRNRFSTLAAGLFVIYALTAFTALSFTVGALIAVSGLGALLLALFKKPVLIVQTQKTG